MVRCIVENGKNGRRLRKLRYGKSAWVLPSGIRVDNVSAFQGGPMVFNFKLSLTFSVLR